MKTESKNEGVSNDERKPLPSVSVDRFNDIEDRLAQALTSDEIKLRSSELFAEVRKALSSNPPDFETAKVATLELKQLNRLSNFRNQRLKNEVQSLQNNADLVYLSYKNLANEISHIRKSIAVCLDFRSADLDLDLVPVEEFFEKGAKEIGFDLNQKNDEHQVRIGRLNYELAQRNAMCDILREQEDLKSLLSSDIKGKINRLNQIKPLIGTIRDSAKPLLEILNLKKVAEFTPESRRRAQMLPKELKLLHLYCNVYNELYPDETLIYGCEGEVQAVEKFEKCQKSQTPEPEEEKMEVDEEEPAVKMDEDEGVSAPKRRRTAKDEKNAQKLREKIFQAHPIALTLAIPSGEMLVNMHFNYLPEIRCITVKSMVTGNFYHSKLFLSENLFNDLLEKDLGDACPNEIGSTLLEFAGVNISDHLATIGKLYRFAQIINSTSEESASSSSPQFDNFKQFVNAARQRIIERWNLSNKIHFLESRTYERAFPSFVKPVESKTQARLSKVKVDFSPAENSLQQSANWQSEFYDKVAKNGHNGFHFRCNVDCDKIALSVLVFIPYSYPKTSPKIVFDLNQPLESEKLTSALKNFEKTLNLEVPSKAKKEKADVFSTQIATLVQRFPIVFQFESEESGVKSESIIDLLFV